MHVPCGTCIHCLSNRQREWAFRLDQENKISKASHFVTLTYANQHLPILELADKDGVAIYMATLVKRDLQLFIKRLRKQQQVLESQYQKLPKVQQKQKEWPKIRFYATGEYGSETKRPHYHLILFNTNPKAVQEMDQIWGKGQVDIGDVTEKSIAYVTKYLINSRLENYGSRQKPFNTMSRKPGLGNNYLQAKKWHLENKNFYVLKNGKKQGIPNYYKGKIFTKRQIEDNKLKTEEDIIKSKIKEDQRIEDLGNNPSFIWQQNIENKLKRAVQQNKKNSL